MQRLLACQREKNGGIYVDGDQWESMQGELASRKAELEELGEELANARIQPWRRRRSWMMRARRPTHSGSCALSRRRRATRRSKGNGWPRNFIERRCGAR